MGEADRDQYVLCEDKAQRAGLVLIFVLVMGRDRHGDGEDAVLILQPAGEFDFLQLLARGDIQPVFGAGLADLLR